MIINSVFNQNGIKNKFKINFIKTLKRLLKRNHKCWFQIMKYLHKKLLQFVVKHQKRRRERERVKKTTTNKIARSDCFSMHEHVDIHEQNIFNSHSNATMPMRLYNKKCPTNV